MSCIIGNQLWACAKLKQSRQSVTQQSFCYYKSFLFFKIHIYIHLGPSERHTKRNILGYTYHQCGLHCHGLGNRWLHGTGSSWCTSNDCHSHGSSYECHCFQCDANGGACAGLQVLQRLMSEWSSV